jgi:hypothetical protein
MRKKVKQLWVNALRSGKYEQGRKVLCSLDNKYCCLGVLTEVYIEQMKKKSKVNKLPSTFVCSRYQYRVEGEHNATCLLPKVVEKWAGLNQNQVNWATCMNDSCGF